MRGILELGRHCRVSNSFINHLSFTPIYILILLSFLIILGLTIYWHHLVLLILIYYLLLIYIKLKNYVGHPACLHRRNFCTSRPPSKYLRGCCSILAYILVVLLYYCYCIICTFSAEKN